MRAILIDPFSKEVLDRDIPNAELDTIYEEIGADCLDTVRLGAGVVAFVDDVGLKRKNQQFWFFDSPGAGVLMAGKALLLSVDQRGETVDLDPRAVTQGLREIVRFIGDGRAADRAIEMGVLDRPEIWVNGEIIWTWTPKDQVL